jgi:hypothetical protein
VIRGGHGLLIADPQVNAEVSMIANVEARAASYCYLRGIVEA